MAGKFINTNKQDIIQNSVETVKNRLENNKYTFMTSEKPTIITYYNVNEEKTVLDMSGTQDSYQIIGKDSPFRYNKINNLPIAGFDKIIAQLELTEMGIEGSEITGEITIYPDTIKAHVNDMFIIPYLKENFVFQIVEVQYDTLDNGSNYNRVQYTLYGGNDKYKYIEKQVVETFNTIIDNIGSSYKAIIKSEYYELIEKWDDVLVSLKSYYKSLFYNPRVQTFIFYNSAKDTRFYDPYMIEFLKKHDLLSGDDNYIHISHQCGLNQTFPIEYDKTFFRCLEKCDKDNINKYDIIFVGELIRDITSIFNTRVEDYYKVIYNYPNQLYNYLPFNIVEADLIRRIEECDYYTKEENKYLNIIINYFNDIALTEDNLKSLDNIEFNTSTLLFYYIPMIIYCGECYIKELLVKHVDN